MDWSPRNEVKAVMQNSIEKEFVQDSLAMLIEKRDSWLVAQIRQLSIAVLDQGSFTCTACGEVSGAYIITRNQETLRLSAPETYAHLQFLLSDTEQI